MQEHFLKTINDFESILQEINQGKVKMCLTLKDLSKMHHLLQSLREYDSRIKQYLNKTSSEHLKIQEILCQKIDNRIEEFHEKFQLLDKLILYILNQTIEQNTMKQIMSRISKVVLGSQVFMLLRYMDNKLEFFSTENKCLNEEAKVQLFDSLKGNGIEVLIPNESFQKILGYSNLKAIRVPSQNQYCIILFDGMNLLPTQRTKQLKKICDQLIAMGCDCMNGFYHKEDLISQVRAASSYLIKNASSIFQNIIKKKINDAYNTNCEIIISQKHSLDVSFAILENTSKCFIPVMRNKNVDFYIHLEGISLDLLTFADYLSKTWMQFQHKLKEQQNKEFLYQIIEVSNPSKLVMATDSQFNIVYQSSPVPSSWKFLDLSGQSLDYYQNLHDIHMEEVHQLMLLSALENVQTSRKGAVDAGQIIYHDKYVDMAIYVQRDENQDNTRYFITFDQPKKRFESQRQSKSDIKVQETLAGLKQEKIEKALTTLQETLNLALSTQDIMEMLQEHKGQEITEDVRQTYVLEYYRNGDEIQTYKRATSETDTPFATKTLIQEQQLTNAKKMEIFQLRPDEADALNDWCFDITSQKDQIKHFTWAMFHLLNYFDRFQIYKDIFFQFLVALEDRYNHRRNPFHNFEHGFTVAHACYFMIRSKLLDKYLDETEQFAAILSSLCHDVDHSGRTNAFEVARMSKLAVRYNDESVLENHHASMTFKIMSRDKYNILSNLSQEQFQKVRKLIVTNILATDMKKHFDLMQTQEQKFKTEELLTFEQKRNLSGLLIHTCDLTSPTKRFEITKKWSIRIQNEFDNQVEEERLLGLPVTQHLVCQNLPKQELSFIKNIIKPLYLLTSTILNGGLQVAIERLEQNEQEWTKLLM